MHSYRSLEHARCAGRCRRRSSWCATPRYCITSHSAWQRGAPQITEKTNQKTPTKLKKKWIPSNSARILDMLGRPKTSPPWTESRVGPPPSRTPDRFHHPAAAAPAYWGPPARSAPPARGPAAASEPHRCEVDRERSNGG